MRPGFAAALEQIAGNGVRTIIVETANRFARDLIVQETGFRRLQADGITLIAADKPDSFVDDTPTAVLVRQILGAVAQFDKAMTVAKLRGARERKRRKTAARWKAASVMQSAVAVPSWLRSPASWQGRLKALRAGLPFARSQPNWPPAASPRPLARPTAPAPSNRCWRTEQRPPDLAMRSPVPGEVVLGSAGNESPGRA